MEDSLRFRRTPYPFQELPIALGRRRNLLLADDCGLGKKVTCIEVANDIYQSEHKPVLIVTVRRDIAQWVDEIKRQLGEDLPTCIGTVDAVSVPHKTDFWLIIHYEGLVRHIKALARIKWGVAIMDEGHYIKNWQAQRSRAAKRVKALRKIVSTGTPIDKSPKDLWSLLDFLYPETYHGKKLAFEDEHVRRFFDAEGHERILPGAKNPAKLAAELAPFTVGRTKEEVAPFLPPNIIKHVVIELDGQQAKLYRRIATSTDIEVLGPELDNPLYIPTRLTQLLRLQQVTTDPQLLQSAANSAKLDWVQTWLEGNPDEPTIIFTCYKDTAHRLSRKLDAHLIAGGVKLPTKWTKKIIVSTIAAGAEALNLDWVRTAIFVDVTWKSLKMKQAQSRIHRLSNTEPCETIFLRCPDTVDDLMLEAVEKKWEAYDLLRGYVNKFGRQRASAYASRSGKDSSRVDAG